MADLPQTISIQSQLANLPFEIIRDVKQVFDVIYESDDPVQKGKEILYLTRNKGAFIKECPGTSSYTCCGYNILHIGTFCTMDCSY